MENRVCKDRERLIARITMEKLNTSFLFGNSMYLSTKGTLNNTMKTSSNDVINNRLVIRKQYVELLSIHSDSPCLYE